MPKLLSGTLERRRDQNPTLDNKTADLQKVKVVIDVPYPREIHSVRRISTQAHQAQQPSGYVWNAWAKGYKLGVQSSSDHISTHTSYACVLAEHFTRQGILDAIRRRHTYAATDNIIVDFRIGRALMGDIIESAAPAKLSVRIIGTAAIPQIDVIKNNKYVHQLKPGRNDVAFEYLDNAIQAGESYYYVRVEQSDGQLAWSSPIWVKYR